MGGKVEYIKPGKSDIEVFERLLSNSKTAEDPFQKYAYIDMLTDWLFYMARHMKYPPAYIAFYGIVNSIMDIKKILEKSQVEIIPLIQKVIDYYSEVLEALKAEKVEHAEENVIKAIEKIAIPLRFELYIKYSFYSK